MALRASAKPKVRRVTVSKNKNSLNNFPPKSFYLKKNHAFSVITIKDFGF